MVVWGFYAKGLAARQAVPPDPACRPANSLSSSPSAVWHNSCPMLVTVSFSRIGSSSLCNFANSLRDETCCCHDCRDSRKLSTCRATSQLERGKASWHIIVACMIVFVFLGLRTQDFCHPNKKRGWGRGHGCECRVRNNIHYKDGKQTAATIPLRTTLSPVLPQFASFSKDRETAITTLLHAQHITRQQPLQHLLVCWSKNNISDSEGPKA